MRKKWMMVLMAGSMLAIFTTTTNAGFVNNGNGTVTDTATGLTWQQATAPGTYIWEAALVYCEGLTLGGRSDWHLPTIKELDSIVDLSIPYPGPTINTTYFPDTAASGYWSSTSNVYSTLEAWGAVFDGQGDGFGYYKRSSLCVRAVRGGQPGSLGDSVILSPMQASSWNIGRSMPIRWITCGLGTNVKISLSRQGGLPGTFETIIASTPNDDQYDWTITGEESANCVIKIEQVDNAANSTSEGPFVIKEAPIVNQGVFFLLLD